MARSVDAVTAHERIMQVMRQYDISIEDVRQRCAAERTPGGRTTPIDLVRYQYPITAVAALVELIAEAKAK
jgi:hypothetical protein